MSIGKPGWDKWEPYIDKAVKMPMTALETYTDSRETWERDLVREACRHAERETFKKVLETLKRMRADHTPPGHYMMAHLSSVEAEIRKLSDAI